MTPRLSPRVHMSTIRVNKAIYTVSGICIT